MTAIRLAKPLVHKLLEFGMSQDREAGESVSEPDDKMMMISDVSACRELWFT